MRQIARVIKEMTVLYLKKNVSRSAAALSYYLTISVFPILICVSAILGSMQIYETDIFGFLRDIVPGQAISAMTEFLRYIVGNRSELMLVIGVAAMLTTSSAAFRSFISITGEIQGEMRFKGIWRGIFSILFSLAFLAAVYVSALVLLSGGWLMHIIEENFGFAQIIELWTWVRFVVLFLLLFCVIYGMYLISAPKETKRTHRLPGAFAASVVLVVASIIYSRMISASLKYALLYGSLASFIILMVWLYTCSTILIMGNVFNISLQRNRELALHLKK